MGKASSRKKFRKSMGEGKLDFVDSFDWSNCDILDINRDAHEGNTVIVRKKDTGELTLVWPVEEAIIKNLQLTRA